MAKTYKSLPMTGGLNFEKPAASRPLAARSKPPGSDKSESQHQIDFFNIIKANAPRPGLDFRRDKKGNLITLEDLNDEKYRAHPFYILTRVRHFPNGGYRHPSVARQLKAEGVKPGAFDIFLDAARHGYHGLRLELKVNRNDLTENQIEEREWLDAEGYSTHVCWHYLEAIEILAWYCSINPKRLHGYQSRDAAMLDLPKKGGHDERCNCPLNLKQIRLT